MAIFEWSCSECNIYWDRECPVGKAPDRTKCPECKKLSSRYYGNANIGVSFNDDKDFHTVRRRYQKHAQKGYDKDSANRFLRKSIEGTKRAMDDESFRYKSANFNYEKMEKDGLIKRVSESESRKKVENARKLTLQAYDNATKRGYKDINDTKLDITKPQKQQ